MGSISSREVEFKSAIELEKVEIKWVILCVALRFSTSARKSSHIDFFCKTFTAVRLWVTHVRNVIKLGVTEFVAEIRFPKDHPKSEKSRLVTEFGCSLFQSKNIANKSLKYKPTAWEATSDVP